MLNQSLFDVLKKHTQENQQKILREVKKDIYRESLFLFAKNLCGFNEITEHTHLPMISALENKETLRKLIVVPRGCFKSSIGSVAYPMWLLENNPNLRIMLDSELYANSKNLLREIRSHYESERYISVFGPRRHDVWNEGEIIISSRTQVKKEPSINCSGIGVQRTGQHYDVIIADDLNSPGNTKNPDVAESVRNHFRYYTSILDPGGTLVIIATRYSELDVIQMILDNEIGVTSEELIKQRGLLNA
jgi:hypothetical protein